MVTAYDDLVERWEAFPDELPAAREINCSNDLNVCAVYVVVNLWEDSYRYLDALYLSLLSQANFTDIDRADVKIFVDESLVEQAHQKLDAFQVEIIPIPGIMWDYNLITHSSLEGYDKLVFWDADVYFLGSKKEIYARISEMEIEHLGIIPEPTSDFGSILKTHFGLTTADDPQEYLHSFAEGLDISDKGMTELISSMGMSYYGFFWVCSPEAFRTEEWERYSQACLDIQNGSTECVLAIYARHNDWQLYNILAALSQDCLAFLGPSCIEVCRGTPIPNWLCILHPHSPFGIKSEIIRYIISSQADGKLSPQNERYYRVLRYRTDFDSVSSDLFLPEESGRKKIFCLGCSFCHFRFGYSQFLFTELGESNVDIWNLGLPGASTFLFAQLADMISASNPHVAILKLMSPTRTPSGTSKSAYFFYTMMKGAGRDPSRRVQMWWKYCRGSGPFTSLSGHTDAQLDFEGLESEIKIQGLPGRLDISWYREHEINDLRAFRSKIACPVIFLANKYDYPYYGYYDEMMESVRTVIRDEDVLLETGFQGPEYSTLGPYERKSCWHPSALRLQEEAKSLADVIQTSFPLE